jgi:hypothetical protein
LRGKLATYRAAKWSHYPINIKLALFGCHGQSESMKPESTALDPESLRRSFHQEIDGMEPERLVLLRQVLRQLELVAIAAQLDRDFDRDRAAGRLDPVAIQAAIAAVQA